ncbi:mandelate racemase/muconate lactonizing enzyme family protein [Jannaschia sp. M317]|uniref:mandelate racemase/muconate lactonizing enzyme family protein n=1 Tax=Jannaschia sp. M317 TaxID=2867011 RepID=UPI0021A3FBB4|nr:mandelate racemase/muconate lactonizing enzyme family protein [Jannaschia sp. M317]UWQ19921.1 mandelate racemase/muconate lactonizing enzyme family protein [Jannaschia sp. M317]
MTATKTASTGASAGASDAAAARIASIEPLLARVGIRNQLLVKITTEDGLVGWGESGLSAREAEVAACIRTYETFLKGQDSRRIGRIWQETYRSQYFEGGRVLTAAMSAVDIALYDLLGKRLGVPVYQLLGGMQRERVSSFASATGNDIDETVAQVRQLVDAGWTCVRLAPEYDQHNLVHDARASLRPTAEKLIAVREAFGKDLVLGIDYHHRLSPAETVSFCNMMPTGTLDFLEEPIRCETPEAYAHLRRMVDVPFAVGEEFASKWQAGPYLEQGLTQFMRLDICNIGGFTEAMKVAGWSERHYVDLMPHNPLGPVCTAATAHLCAAVPNFSWVETRQSPVESLGFHDPALFPVQVPMEGPDYVLTDTPGLGVEVDEDAIRAAPQPEHFEPPHLRHPDGSVTNW